MKNSKIINIFSSGNIVIPIYLLKNYKNFNLEIKEFIFLMYLYSLGNKIVFNPSKYGDDLNIDLNEVMNNISVLSEKGFIKVEVIDNDKGLKEEVVILDDFFQKISLLAIEEVNNSKEESNIFELIEKEFGRTLGPIEYVIISAWLDNNYSEELIKEALKEATFNGVSNLKYIDKILYEWSKAGIVDINGVEERRKKHKSKKSEKDDIDLELVDWNWFDDDE